MAPGTCGRRAGAPSGGACGAQRQLQSEARALAVSDWSVVRIYPRFPASDWSEARALAASDWSVVRIYPRFPASDWSEARALTLMPADPL
eukprot:1043496-Prorocentrum_minimum.AAC.1